MNSLSIRFEHIRHDDGVGKSMWDVVLTTQSVGDRMNVADIGAGKRFTGKKRGVKHVASCFHIVSILVYAFNILNDEAYGFFGVLACLFCVGVANVGFYGMA